MLFAVTGIAVVAAVACAAVAWRVLRDEQRRSSARVAALAAAIDADSTLASVATPVSSGALFARRDARSMEQRPLITAGVSATMFVALLAGAGVQWRSGDLTEGRSTITQAPIELMSMGHVRERDSFTVRGLVRNPRGGDVIDHVSAVVFVFDRQGNYITSSRAPLDAVTLDPGGESPFVVSVPGAGDVGRYRVTFRTELGVVRHIDRREPSTQLASHTE